MTTVCVSGYFTVLHKGHINLFEEARKLGDKLIVIINNNNQQIAKKGKLIHDAEDIKYIIERLKMVDEAVISIDKDASQCETLRMIKPDIFANGGDRNQENVPETPVCAELNIKMVDNVGGEKLNSSSDILKKGEQ
ncbi:adenylyltransferase/cytidyltransferase family protein [Candidatus Woesearchaeota archaeon]|nr:adenylyltransferase/cytidyltransferase family protein [Candidatus Woesearchaeota archaeon]